MLGDALRDAREEAELTQEEVAVKAKISREYVSIVERNRRSPTVDVLLRMCKAIGVPASEIIREVEK